MKLYTIDKIVRGALIDRGYTMHWYLQFLNYAVNCYRELNFDVLQNIKSVRLPVNSYLAATLPTDYVDWVRVGDQYGQYIAPYGEKKNTYNRLNNFDDLGNKIPYGDVENQSGLLPSNWEGYWYTNYINDKGEHMGRIFNNRPTFRNSFVIIRERDEMQLDSAYYGSEIVLDYITDGTSTTASNSVHPYAVEAIKCYIFWKQKEHGRHYNAQERELSKQQYYTELRLLRARMNNMDVQDIRRSLDTPYGPTIKN